jgi:hypothetical protein
VGQPEKFEGTEAQHKSLRKSIDDGGRRLKEVLAETKCQKPKKTPNTSLGRLQDKKEWRRILGSLASTPWWLLSLASAAAFLFVTSNGLLFRIVQLIHIIDPEAKQIVAIPIDHVKFSLVIQVQLKPQEEFCEHHLQTLLHDPYPARAGISQVYAEGLLQFLIKAPSFMLKGVEIRKDMGKTPETSCSIVVGQLE